MDGDGDGDGGVERLQMLDTIPTSENELQRMIFIPGKRGFCISSTGYWNLGNPFKSEGVIYQQPSQDGGSGPDGQRGHASALNLRHSGVPKAQDISSSHILTTFSAHLF